MKVAAATLLRPVRVGAGAELLPRGSLLAAAAAAAAGAVVALLFEADAVFLFKPDAVPLDIAGEARGGYQRRLKRAAKTVEGMEWRGNIARLRDLARGLVRNLHPARAAGSTWRRLET